MGLFILPLKGNEPVDFMSCLIPFRQCVNKLYVYTSELHEAE